MPEKNNSNSNAVLSNSKRKRGNPNIKQHAFKPGQSGNPGGRPKRMRTLISLAISDSLAEKANDDRTYADLIGEKIVKEAATGENWLPAAKEALDRTEGKPAQAIKLDADIQTTSAERVKEIISAISGRIGEAAASRD